MQLLDMTGKPCPIPLVEAKKTLAAADVNGVHVLVDNIVAVQNLEKMANGLGYLFHYQQEGPALYRVELQKDGTVPSPATTVPPVQAAQAASIHPGTAGNLRPTVLISSGSLGRGSDELGKLLIKGYIFSLTELDPLPKSVIFINGGAYLTCAGSNTVDDLKTLEAAGVEILTCGTCLNYYELSNLAVGTITDMMGISTRLASAERLISL